MEHQIAAKSPRRGIPLWIKIMIGLCVGAAIGYTWPVFGAKLQPIGTAFIKALKMIVIPLIFSAVTLAVYKMGSNLKQLGKLGICAFTWFYFATAVSVAIGITLSLIFQPGAGMVMPNAQSVVLPDSFGKSVDYVKFFLDIIPDNIIANMAAQKIIPTLFFSICFGLCLAKIGEKAKVVISLLDAVMHAMFKLCEGIIAVSPYAVAGIVAWVFATQGGAMLVSLLKLIGVCYLGLLVMLVFFGFVTFLAGHNPVQVLRKVLEPFLLGFSTASSEVTLPLHMEILEKNGIPNRVVAFVLPLGYSFNLDGAALGQSLYVCFIAHMYGLNLDVASLVSILVTTVIANKGTANIPGVTFVVVSAILGSLGLPLEGMAVLMAVDRFMDMGRTAINVLGNTVACLLLYKVAGSDITDEEEAAEMNALAQLSDD